MCAVGPLLGCRLSRRYDNDGCAVASLSGFTRGTRDAFRALIALVSLVAGLALCACGASGSRWAGFSGGRNDNDRPLTGTHTQQGQQRSGGNDLVHFKNP